MKRISIFGSTGSIGTQTLDILRQHPDKLEVKVLTAGSNAELLVEQAREFHPQLVVISDPSQTEKVKQACQPLGIEVLEGKKGIHEAAGFEDVDMVVTAMVGYAGLEPTIRALELGKNIALANKETLVVAGSLISCLAEETGAKILPVDSEHSAIFQCLEGEDPRSIKRIILTASGGPFRGKKSADLEKVTIKDALNHPNWSMGAKITIDSATLMNKGLEVIEAKWLFGLNPGQVDVVVHPQSIIHSMVEFRDTSVKAQLGIPDMRLPIQYALLYPERQVGNFPVMDFSKTFSLDFEPPDKETFQNLQWAFDSMVKGGNLPCILNAANEVAVNGFLEDRLDFLGIARLNKACMDKMPWIEQPTLEDLKETDRETRALAQTIMNTWKD